MPKVVLNPSFTAYQGKLGNIVYQEGREGTISRRYVVPANPQTPIQVQARAAFAQASEAYKTLTAEELAAWREYAQGITRRGRNGKSFHPAAMEVFTGLGSKFLQVNPGAPVPTLPPTDAFTYEPVTLAAIGQSGTVLFTAIGANSDVAVTELLLQKLVDANRKPEDGKYRTQNFTQFYPGSETSFVVVAAGWYAPAYRFVNAVTGQMTPLLTLPTVHAT